MIFRFSRYFPILFFAVLHLFSSIVIPFRHYLSFPHTFTVLPFTRFICIDSLTLLAEIEKLMRECVLLREKRRRNYECIIPRERKNDQDPQFLTFSTNNLRQISAFYRSGNFWGTTFLKRVFFRLFYTCFRYFDRAGVKILKIKGYFSTFSTLTYLILEKCFNGSFPFI